MNLYVRKGISKKRLSKIRRAAFKRGGYEHGCGKSDLRHLTCGWNH